MYSVLLTSRNITAKKYDYWIPWRDDTSSFNMMNESPNLTINVAKGRWKYRLKKIADLVEVVFIDKELEEKDYVRIFNDMPNVRSLYIFYAGNLSNIGFVEKMKKLENLMICRSRISDLEPLKRLVEIQKKEKSNRYLKCVAIVDSEVVDVSCVSELWFSEFVMDHYKIDPKDKYYQMIIKKAYCCDERKINAILGLEKEG